MIEEKAKSLFHGAEKLNCAQAVLKAYQDDFDVSDETITENKKNGGGRAEGGICGALEAAYQLLPEKRSVITEQFCRIAGSTTCNGIKRVSKYPCKECVGLAAAIVEGLLED